MSLVLVVGGVRSGKSRFAEDLLVERSSQLHYIATAEPFDDEMRERITTHQQRRGDFWQTIEAPVDLPSVIENHDKSDLLIDCAAVWIGNLMHHELSISSNSERLVDALSERKGRATVVVSQEVGLGGIEMNAMARRYADEVGSLNQQIAAISDQVFLVVAGQALCVKGAS